MAKDTITDGTAEGSDPCCAPPGDVDSDAMATDLQVLTAMGNDTRYELLRRIANADDGVCVCDLEAAVGVSQSAVSQALSRLYTAQLVTRRKEGSWRYYEPTETTAALLETLDDLRGTHE
ncbi:ArsR/SmtB family transcription factor [Natronorubrum aibiense]|uniref:Metalloregulator ArsR/SmtB family transcription factor n=1 Tax=Natronorubrum aibiense TaxID=348826 RepID=A0A5P9P8S7_9EURY|nr:metalloregulator ArsR/SmtB family transcription factor [Natronorubrum aibiense]QFU84523.1 metalloregulator ArsR/SmtB family transcription factor [Natronorubrum aibiense]